MITLSSVVDAGHTFAYHARADSFNWDNASTIMAGIGAALIAALVAVAGYAIQQRAARREQRARTYAEALQAVEDYLEGPYRIRRRDGSAEARRQIAETMSGVKSRINFHQAWLRVHGTPAVADAYDALVLAAQREAGPQMTAAWQGRPTRKDRDVPLGRPFDRTSSDVARVTVIAAMRKDLGE